MPQKYLKMLDIFFGFFGFFGNVFSTENRKKIWTEKTENFFSMKALVSIDACLLEWNAVWDSLLFGSSALQGIHQGRRNAEN